MSGEFIARMEDVLDLYHEEYDPERPVVCFDETSKQLLGDVRPPIEAAPGRMGRYDTEYQRNGTRNLFMFCEPKGGWRRVEVTVRRTAVDFAHRMKWLVDQAYPDATVVRLVLDNLNTHCGQSQHPQVGLALRGSCAVRGAPHSQAPGVSPHTRSRKLAEHG